MTGDERLAKLKAEIESEREVASAVYDSIRGQIKAGEMEPVETGAVAMGSCDGKRDLCDRLLDFIAGLDKEVPNAKVQGGDSTEPDV